MKNFIKTLFATNLIKEKTQVALIENEMGATSGQFTLNATAVAIDKVSIAAIGAATIFGTACNIMLAQRLEKKTFKNHPAVAKHAAVVIGAITGLGLSQVVFGIKKRNELIEAQKEV